MAFLRQRVDDWMSVLPPLEILQEGSNTASWARATLVAAVIIGLSAWVPFTSHIVQLKPWPAVGAFAASFALNIVEQWALRHRKLRTLALLFTAGSAMFQLFVVLLAVNSSMVGAVFFGACLIVLASVHGHTYRSSWRFPFIGLATLTACGIGALLAPTREHLALLGIVGPVSSIFASMIGWWAATTERSRSEAEQLRAAIQAQLTWEHSLRADRLAGSLEQVAQWNHDMRNALTSVVGNAKLLAELGKEGAPAIGPGEMRISLDSMKRSLEVVVAGFDDLRRISRFAEATLVKQPVAVLPIAETVVSGARFRFPHADVALSRDAIPASVLIHGGSVSVHRIIENLVVNACEGDGTTGARHVEVTVREISGAVRLEVRDDGPGFPAGLLEGPSPAFGTTKKNGTGLGLHSVEQLVAANRGRFIRANAPQGGAVAVVELPVASAPALEGSAVSMASAAVAGSS